MPNQTDNDVRAHTDSPGSTLSWTDQRHHCKMTISVLPHSSRSKAVCVQNVICLLRNLCSTFTKILCYVDKTAGYSYRRIG